MSRASIRLEFDVQHCSIKVIGLLDDVEKAVKLIEANYLKVVCYDKYEVNIQGKYILGNLPLFVVNICMYADNGKENHKRSRE